MEASPSSSTWPFHSDVRGSSFLQVRKSLQVVLIVTRATPAGPFQALCGSVLVACSAGPMQAMMAAGHVDQPETPHARGVPQPRGLRPSGSAAVGRCSESTFNHHDGATVALALAALGCHSLSERAGPSPDTQNLRTPLAHQPSSWRRTGRTSALSVCGASSTTEHRGRPSREPGF